MTDNVKYVKRAEKNKKSNQLQNRESTWYREWPWPLRHG